MRMVIKAAELQIEPEYKDHHDIGNMYWRLADQIAQLEDEVESGETLQARQTFSEIKAEMEALERYIESLPTQDNSNAQS